METIDNLAKLSDDLEPSDMFKAHYDALVRKHSLLLSQLKDTRDTVKATKIIIAATKDELLLLGKRYSLSESESKLPIVAASARAEEWKALPIGVLAKYGLTKMYIEDRLKYDTLGDLDKAIAAGESFSEAVTDALAEVVEEVSSKIAHSVSADETSAYAVDPEMARLPVTGISGVTDAVAERLADEKIKTIKQLAEWMTAQIPNSAKRLKALVRSEAGADAIIAALDVLSVKS